MNNYNYLLDKLSEKTNNLIKPDEFFEGTKNYKSNDFFILICTLCNNKFNKRINSNHILSQDVVKVCCN